MGDCVLWTGPKRHHGYGAVRRDGKLLYAHRVAFAEAHGREPVGVVRHACDNTSCVNPAHLVEGTQADNLRDARERGRHVSGWGDVKAAVKSAATRAARTAVPTHCGCGRTFKGEFGLATHRGKARCAQ